MLSECFDTITLKPDKIMDGVDDEVLSFKNYLNESPQIRVIEAFNEENNSSLVGTAFVPVDDLEPEVLGWTMSCLVYARCPLVLASAIARKVFEEISTSDVLLEEFQKSSEGYLDQTRLYQIVNQLIPKIISEWSESLPLERLNINVPRLKVSYCAIKNSRRKMEDRHVIIPDLNVLLGLKGNVLQSFYAVFDGHAGAEAAVYASSHLHYNIVTNSQYPSDIPTAIKKGFRITDEKFLLKSDKENLKSGSTALCCLVRENKLFISWLGDSQAFIVRNGVPVNVMNPHKPDREDERQRIESLGGCVLHYGTWRVNGALAVSRAIGDKEYKPYVSSEADIVTFDLDGSEDYVVMACDGMWDMLNIQDVMNYVYTCASENPGDLPGVSSRLVQIAKERGSGDNITVLVIFLKNIHEIAEPQPSVCSEPNMIPESPPPIKKELNHDEKLFSNFENGNLLPDTPSAQQNLQMFGLDTKMWNNQFAESQFTSEVVKNELSGWSTVKTEHSSVNEANLLGFDSLPVEEKIEFGNPFEQQGSQQINEWKTEATFSSKSFNSTELETKNIQWISQNHVPGTNPFAPEFTPHAQFDSNLELKMPEFHQSPISSPHAPLDLNMEFKMQEANNQSPVSPSTAPLDLNTELKMQEETRQSPISSPLAALDLNMDYKLSETHQSPIASPHVPLDLNTEFPNAPHPMDFNAKFEAHHSPVSSPLAPLDLNTEFKISGNQQSPISSQVTEDIIKSNIDILNENVEQNKFEFDELIDNKISQEFTSNIHREFVDQNASETSDEFLKTLTPFDSPLAFPAGVASQEVFQKELVVHHSELPDPCSKLVFNDVEPDMQDPRSPIESAPLEFTVDESNISEFKSQYLNDNLGFEKNLSPEFNEGKVASPISNDELSTQNVNISPTIDKDFKNTYLQEQHAPMEAHNEEDKPGSLLQGHDISDASLQEYLKFQEQQSAGLYDVTPEVLPAEQLTEKIIDTNVTESSEIKVPGELVVDDDESDGEEWKFYRGDDKNGVKNVETTNTNVPSEISLENIAIEKQADLSRELLDDLVNISNKLEASTISIETEQKSKDTEKEKNGVIVPATMKDTKSVVGTKTSTKTSTKVTTTITKTASKASVTKSAVKETAPKPSSAALKKAAAPAPTKAQPTKTAPTKSSIAANATTGGAFKTSTITKSSALGASSAKPAATRPVPAKSTTAPKPAVGLSKPSSAPLRKPASAAEKKTPEQNGIAVKKVPVPSAALRVATSPLAKTATKDDKVKKDVTDGKSTGLKNPLSTSVRVASTRTVTAKTTTTTRSEASKPETKQTKESVNLQISNTARKTTTQRLSGSLTAKATGTGSSPLLKVTNGVSSPLKKETAGSPKPKTTPPTSKPLKISSPIGTSSPKLKTTTPSKITSPATTASKAKLSPLAKSKSPVSKGAAVGKTSESTPIKSISETKEKGALDAVARESMPLESGSSSDQSPNDVKVTTEIITNCENLIVIQNGHSQHEGESVEIALEEH